MSTGLPHRYGPRPAISPAVTCLGCNKDLTEGDYTALIPIGPDERARARMARPYTAVGIEVHYACATGWEDRDAV
jgi:hypothetical protein